MIVTLVTGGLLGLVYLLLSWRVVAVRRAAGIGLGDGGDTLLLQRIRAHANFAEYVPFCLILIGAIEMSTLTSSPLLWAAGLALVLVRIAHAIGMARERGNPFRLVGALGTWIVMTGLSVGALVTAIGLLR